MQLTLETLNTDILIIGGGTAGCFAALTIADESNAGVVIAEKANIKRSGCLAAGVNALNAYLNEGETPETFVDYVKQDAEGIVREDLVYTIAQRLNQVTSRIEGLGLPIMKDEAGNYISRGRGSIKINGENLKPILAHAVAQKMNVQVLNRVNIIDYILQNGKVVGAYGFSLDKPVFYAIYAKSVICATGGASGLYKPNNPGASQHKMWYSPFNTGAGYAMGIRAGAEMTTLEMRFIALRCKDTIAPTGTIAQGMKAKQTNSRGELYVTKYGKATTPIRLLATVRENQGGRGPCYLETTGITAEQEQELFKAYLNMAPAQALYWIDRGQGPRAKNVEIEGTEPYIVGGHTASGYWVDTRRATTLPGLFAAGDVAGGSPKKYVTGCFAEGEIAARAALDYIKNATQLAGSAEDTVNRLSDLNRYLNLQESLYKIEELEEAMQKVMDEYAGGIQAGYAVNEAKLKLALAEIQEIQILSEKLKAVDLQQLVFIHELRDRLQVCQALLHHLLARQETRWPMYQQNLDYPDKDDANWLKYVNSRYIDGQFTMIFRDLVGRDEFYEH